MDGARIVRRLHQPKSKLLGLFLGLPVGGQNLFTRDGIDDDDVENVSALTHIRGQRQGVVAVGGYQGSVRLRLDFYHLDSHPFIYSNV